MKETIQHVEDWYLDRPTMDEHNTVDKLKDLLCGEVEELCESDADLREELADVLLYTVALFRRLAINEGVDTDTYIQQAVAEKVALNMIRYTSTAFQDGDYDTTMQQQRDVVKQDLIKETFYEYS